MARTRATIRTPVFLVNFGLDIHSNCAPEGPRFSRPGSDLPTLLPDPDTRPQASLQLV